MLSRFLRVLTAMTVVLAPAFACAAGLLEIPAPNSSQSGIGLISGWHCSGARIEISFDLGPPILVSSHTPRDDTAPVCGRSDTGFAMLFNWNILQATICCEIGVPLFHRVTAFADGVQFADVKFQTTSFRTEYLTGASGIYLLRNFPYPGNNTQVAWDQDKQNFTIVSNEGYYGSTPPPGVVGGSGTYFGAVNIEAGNRCANDPRSSAAQTRYGKFIVKADNGQLQLRAEYADGGICQSPVVPVSPDRPLVDGRTKAQFSAADLGSCPEFGGAALLVTVNGKNLDASSLGGCRPASLSAASPSR